MMILSACGGGGQQKTGYPTRCHRPGKGCPYLSAAEPGLY